MTAMDILVLLLVGGAGVTGFWRGLTHELLTLLSWVAGMVALRLAHAPVSAALVARVGTEAGAAVLAFALIFLPVFFITRLIARRAGGYAKSSLLGGVDRVLGAGFGALKGLLVATLVFMLVNLGADLLWGAAAQRPDWMRTSRTFPLLNASSRAVSDFVADQRGPVIKPAEPA